MKLRVKWLLSHLFPAHGEKRLKKEPFSWKGWAPFSGMDPLLRALLETPASNQLKQPNCLLGYLNKLIICQVVLCDNIHIEQKTTITQPACVILCLSKYQIYFYGVLEAAQHLAASPPLCDHKGGVMHWHLASCMDFIHPGWGWQGRTVIYCQSAGQQASSSLFVWLNLLSITTVTITPC